MTDHSRTRMKVSGLVAVSGGIVLLLSILTLRSILLNQVDRGANQAILDEVHEFVAYVDGAHQIGNGEGEQFDSEADLMRGFLARQTPETHEMLVAVSGGETMFLDNAQDGMGQRFVEDSAELGTILDAETASGVQETPGFGEIRWGKVTTDQEGAFLVLHFTTPAEAEAGAVIRTLAWVSALALLLVSTLAWFGTGLVQQIRSGRSGEDTPTSSSEPTSKQHSPLPPQHAATPDGGHSPQHGPTESFAPVRNPGESGTPRASTAVFPSMPMPEHPGDPTVPLSDLLGGPAPEPPAEAPAEEAEPGETPFEEPAAGASAAPLRRISAASLVLHLQHELKHLHPERRFILTLEDQQHDAGHTADVLGALAQIEAELDAEAVETEFLELVSSALAEASPDADEEAGVVILGAGRDAAGERLRLSVSAGSPHTRSMSVPLHPQQEEADEAPDSRKHREAAPSPAGAVVYSMR